MQKYNGPGLIARIKELESALARAEAICREEAEYMRKHCGDNDGAGVCTRCADAIKGSECQGGSPLDIKSAQREFWRDGFAAGRAAAEAECQPLITAAVAWRNVDAMDDDAWNAALAAIGNAIDEVPERLRGVQK